MSPWDSSIPAQTMVLTSNVCFWLGTVLAATWLHRFLIILPWSLRSTVGGIFLKLRYAVKLLWTTESFQIFNKISCYWLLCCYSVSYENYLLQFLVHVCTVCFKTEYLKSYVWKEYEWNSVESNENETTMFLGWVLIEKNGWRFVAHFTKSFSYLWCDP